MKNNLFLIFALTFCASCAIDYDDDLPSKNYSRNIDSRFQRAANKMMRVKPSESMQAGIPKKHIYYEFSNNQRNEEYSDYGNENYYDQRVSSDDYQGHFKIGNPYTVSGVAYFPQNYESFEETGIASWYGDDFHGKLTANGEVYNMSEMTAAHPTLPLPSMVRITNLRNGKSVIVKVNDRGPFAKSRIIDVSEKAAIALEFKDRGTTEVKIQLLRNDTDQLLERLKIRN